MTRRVSIRANLDATYESNIFGVSRTVAQQRGGAGRPLDDFQVSPSLQLNISLPYGRNLAFLRGQIGYDFHAQNEQLNRERIGLDGGTTLAVGGCSTTVSGSYFRNRSNAGDIFAVRANDETLPDVLRIRNNVLTTVSAGADVRCGGAIGLSPSFGYRHTETRNSAPLLQLNNSNVDTFDASIGYQRPALGRVSIFGNYSRAEFQGRDIFFRRRGSPGFDPTILDGVENYSAGLRFERDIGSRAYGVVSVGYTWSNPDSVFSQRFRGTTYDLNLSLRPSERLAVDLLLSRSANAGNAAFASLVITEVYSLNATYRMSDRLSFNAGSSLQNRNFRGAGLTNDLSGFINNDEFVRAYGGVVYDLNRRLRLNALVSQQRRKSDQPIFNFRNTTVSAGISYALGR
jgi:hypothetical protein